MASEYQLPYTGREVENLLYSVPQKVSLPVDSDGEPKYGIAGAYAVSDGSGGVTWELEGISTVKGELVRVDDCAGGVLKGLNIYGKTYQRTDYSLLTLGQSGEIYLCVTNKNLINRPYVSSNTAYTSNGISYTVNDDGSIYAVGANSGSASWSADFRINNFAGALVPLGANFENVDSRISCRYPSGNLGATYQHYPTATSLAAIGGAVGKEIDETFYPQIEFSEEITEWEAPVTLQQITIPTPNGLRGVPVESDGNYTDSDGTTWICDEIDFAKGVHIQRIDQIDSYAGETITTAYLSSTGALDTGATVQYVLSEPVITALSDSVITQYQGIKTHTPTTSVYVLSNYNGYSLVPNANHTPVTLKVSYKTITEQGSSGSSFDATAYGLPVLRLSGDTSAMTKANPVTLDYDYAGLSGTCTCKWQGNSSLMWEKKNYTIKFDQAFEAQDGWGEQKKYCLKANFIDHSHARNIVSAKLWGEIVKSRTGGVEYGFSGAYEASDGHDMSSAYTVEDDVLTVKSTIYQSGSILFNGPTYPAGEHTISFELLNPYTGDTNAERGTAASLAYGVVGNSGNILINSVEKVNEWMERSATVTFPVDGSTFGISIYSFGSDTAENENPTLGYQVRNIKVDGNPYPLTNIQTELPNGGAIDGFPCVVMLNDEFHGLYTWNIPKDGWMMGMSSTTEKQAILCADGSATDACGFKGLANLEDDFELEYVSNESDTDWVLESLNTLIEACMNSDGTDLDTTVAQYLDWSSAIDYMIFTVLIGGIDMYRKNYLLATYDGTKWFFSAYDMDTTYGINWKGNEFYTANAYPRLTEYNHRVMELILAYKSDELKARYEELRESVLSEDNLYMQFTNWAVALPTPLLVKDVERWPSIPSSAASNTAQILNWYRLRTILTDKTAATL